MNPYRENSVPETEPKKKPSWFGRLMCGLNSHVDVDVGIVPNSEKTRNETVYVPARSEYVHIGKVTSVVTAVGCARCDKVYYTETVTKRVLDRLIEP